MQSRKPVLDRDPIINLRLRIVLNPQQSSHSFAESETCTKKQEMIWPSYNNSAIDKHTLLFFCFAGHQI